jgi:hypothetical protein
LYHFGGVIQPMHIWVQKKWVVIVVVVDLR